jgi:hypothetical protein
MEQKTIVQCTLMEQKKVTERWRRRQLHGVPKWQKHWQKDGEEDNCTLFPNGTENTGRKNGAEDNCTVQCAQMEQKTVTERWSRRQLPKWNRKHWQKDGAEDNCIVFPNGTENRGRKMKQKTIVLYSVSKWNRKEGQKNGAEDNSNVQCVQMEQKTGAE